MRILLVVGSLPPMRCGIGDYTLRLAQALAERPNVDVAILTSQGAASAGSDEAVQIFPVMARWTLSERRQAKAVLEQWRPDVVHVQFPAQGYGSGDLPHYLPLMARRARAKVVRTFHEVATWGTLGSRRQLLGFLLHLLVPGPLVSVRPDFRDLLHPKLARLTRGRDWMFIPSASAIPRVRLTGEERDRLRAFHLAGRERLVTFFGFLNRSKGPDLLFDIADHCRDRLVFAGSFGPEPAFADAMRARAEGADWEGKVAFTGFLEVEEVAALLAVSDAVVLPFREGGGSWNTSILAALAQGTPVVTTASQRANLDLGGNVHLSRPGDVADMKSALDRIASPPERRAPDAEPETDWDDVADRHLALYRRMEAR